jgi:hypothetical protein
VNDTVTCDWRLRRDRHRAKTFGPLSSYFWLIQSVGSGRPSPLPERRDRLDGEDIGGTERVDIVATVCGPFVESPVVAENFIPELVEVTLRHGRPDRRAARWSDP